MQNEGPSIADGQANHPAWRGYLLVAAATFCWGAAVTLGKALFNGRVFAGQAQISPLVLTQTRATFATLVLVSFRFLRGGAQAFRISGRDLALCAMIGTLGIAGSNFFYYWAVQHTSVAVAITLQYTAPVWVLLFMFLRGQQRANGGRIAAVLLSLAGVALVIGLFSQKILASPAGISAALLAALSFALYNIGGQALVSRNDPLKIMSYALLSSTVLWLIVNPPWRLLASHFTAGQWGFLFLFACFSLLLPYIFYFNGLKYLDPTRAVVTSCLEPVFAVLFAAMFVHEGLAGGQIAGIAAVLSATVLAQKR